VLPTFVVFHGPFFATGKYNIIFVFLFAFSLELFPCTLDPIDRAPPMGLQRNQIRGKPNNSGTKPNNSGTKPNNSGTKPNNSGTKPNNSGTTPNNSGTKPNNSDASVFPASHARQGALSQRQNVLNAFFGAFASFPVARVANHPVPVRVPLRASFLTFLRL
jgi:hypothetical protein